MITLHCPHCESRLTYCRDSAGLVVRCPECRQLLRVGYRRLAVPLRRRWPFAVAGELAVLAAIAAILAWGCARALP